MRYAILVDAGYFYSGLATNITGSSNRAAVKVHESYLIQKLVEQAHFDCGGELLRVTWYDGAKDGIPDHHQQHIGQLPGVKLRMGRINPYGEQKGVDLRLGLDLVSMAVNRTVQTAYIVSGDDDLSEAVEDAQDLGLQVKVIGIPKPDNVERALGVAYNLSLVSDGVLTIDPKTIATGAQRRLADKEPGEALEAALDPDSTSSTPSSPSPKDLAKRPTPAMIAERQAQAQAKAAQAAQMAPTSVLAYSSDGGVIEHGGHGSIPLEQIQEVARLTAKVWLDTATETEVRQLMHDKPTVPPELDRLLLNDLANASGVYDVPFWARYELRDEFWVAMDQWR
ncbi:NYN domain-containing protein [Brevibacterium sp. 50QC2O2]|jgi:hypothetical protein|uniref:NYN domain-containing protein n=1 Tax=Brevibacterium sp. 50QC2O2 TaxID=2968459 RepID=UPI00211CA96B|nr:NYN domain-containing protein [Brevibacterium sp. 50QC2O2]MCQ9387465.1 NYN domain-containing protein [Brevibacterium sp. 50QC2O2]